MPWFYWNRCLQNDLENIANIYRCTGIVQFNEGMCGAGLL